MWIDVNDAMPKDTDRYIVALGNGQVALAECSLFAIFSDESNLDAEDAQYIPMWDVPPEWAPITHWQPLPEHPNKKSKGPTEEDFKKIEEL